MAASREVMLCFQGKREKKNAVSTSNVDGAGVCNLVVLVVPLVVVVAVHDVFLCEEMSDGTEMGDNL